MNKRFLFAVILIFVCWAAIWARGPKINLSKPLPADARKAVSVELTSVTFLFEPVVKVVFVVKGDDGVDRVFTFEDGPGVTAGTDVLEKFFPSKARKDAIARHLIESGSLSGQVE